MEKVLKRALLFSCPKFEVEEAEVEIADGSTALRWYLSRQPFVGIIPVLPNGDLVLIDEFRSALGERILSLPGGGVGTDESPIDAARRELAEETGYTSEKLELFYEGKSRYATIKEKVYFYVAKDVEETNYESPEWEDIEVRILSLEEIADLLMHDAVTEKVSWILMRYLAEKGFTLIRP